VNVLLDSHTLLWLMEANPSLSATAAALIADPANRLHLSMASVWEIGIKVGLKKMGLSVRNARVPGTVSDYLPFFLASSFGYFLAISCQN